MQILRLTAICAAALAVACSSENDRAADSTAQVPATDSAGGETTDTSSMAGMDHAKMGHGAPPATDSGTPGPMAGMDHSKMPGMSGGGTKSSSGNAMAGIDHSAMPGMSRGGTKSSSGGGAMAGMDHSNMPGMTRPTTKSSAAPGGAVDHAAMGHAPAATPRGTPPRAPQTAAPMDHSRMNNMPATPRNPSAMTGMDHSAMITRPATMTEFGGDAADAKLSRIVALLVRDTIVVRRINAEPDLRRAWQDSTVRRLILNTPEGR